MPCVLEFTPPSSLIKPPSLLMENCQFTSSYRGLSNQALKKALTGKPAVHRGLPGEDSSTVLHATLLEANEGLTT